MDSDLLELMPETSLELIIEDGFRHFDKRNGTKIEYTPIKQMFNNIEIIYTHNWFCQIGDTIFCHPSAYSKGILKTSENAMLYFKKNGYVFKNIVMAHTHRVGYTKIGDTNIYEQGAFCDTSKMLYHNGNLVDNQKEGFVLITQDQNGETIFEHNKLIVLN